MKRNSKAMNAKGTRARANRWGTAAATVALTLATASACTLMQQAGSTPVMPSVPAPVAMRRRGDFWFYAGHSPATRTLEPPPLTRFEEDHFVAAAES